MSYLLSFGDHPDQMWGVSNAIGEHLVETLIQSVYDDEFIEWLKVTTYLNGHSFDTEYDEKNDILYNIKYLDLLKSKMPEIIELETNEKLKKLYSELPPLLNEFGN